MVLFVNSANQQGDINAFRPLFNGNLASIEIALKVVHITTDTRCVSAEVRYNPPKTSHVPPEVRNIPAEIRGITPDMGHVATDIRYITPDGGYIANNTPLKRYVGLVNCFISQSDEKCQGFPVSLGYREFIAVEIWHSEFHRCQPNATAPRR